MRRTAATGLALAANSGLIQWEKKVGASTINGTTIAAYPIAIALKARVASASASFGFRPDILGNSVRISADGKT